MTGTDIVRTKAGRREDWSVPSQNTPVPFVDTDIVKHLRSFFDEMDKEAQQRKDDPIAMVNALARLEALLADVRYVRDTVRTYAAESMEAQHIRKLIIEGLCTMEAVSSGSPRKWNDSKALAMLLTNYHMTDKLTGEVKEADEVATDLLEWFAISYWRVGPFKELGMPVEDFAEQDKDEDGKVVRTPSVRIIDNNMRKPTT